MSGRRVVRRQPIPEPQEPAHGPIFELHDPLREIYVLLRDKYQAVISAAFDQASREIGFVVTTTLPMTFVIGDAGQIKSYALPASSPLKGTLMDKTVTKALKPALGASLSIKPGEYTLFLVWPDALKFKLRKDWFEPAHPTHWLEPAHPGPWTEPAHLPTLDWRELAQVDLSKVIWEVREPAHWFIPGSAISALEALHLSLLDEVYPDLRLMERVVAARRAVQRIPPEVQEPAHFRELVSIIPELPKELLTELAQVLRRHGY